jgi:hypothetical protein
LRAHHRRADHTDLSDSRDERKQTGVNTMLSNASSSVINDDVFVKRKMKKKRRDRKCVPLMHHQTRGIEETRTRKRRDEMT